MADDAARTLTVTLKAPCAYFLELCGFTTFCPVKVDVADAEGAWATKPETFIGTGPFKMVSYKVDDVIEYVKNENYWNAENVKLGGVNAYLSEDSVAILAAYEADAVSFIQTMDPAEFERLNATYPGELVMGEYMYRIIRDKIKASGFANNYLHITVAIGMTSRAIGQKRKNKNRIKEEFGFTDIIYSESDELTDYEFKIDFERK